MVWFFTGHKDEVRVSETLAWALYERSWTVSACMHVCVFSRVWLFAVLWTVAHQAPLSMGFSRQEYRSASSYTSPGDLPNQGLNPGLQHHRQILYQLSHRRSPRILEWVAYAFSSGSFWPKDWAGVCCVAGWFFTNWAISEALSLWVQVEHGLPTLMVCLMLSITLTFMLWRFKARMTLGEAETHSFIKTLPSWHFLKILPTFLT